jgi:hypothetical protein
MLIYAIYQELDMKNCFFEIFTLDYQEILTDLFAQYALSQ